MMTQRLSERQRAMLHFIDRHVRQHGYGPTIREIGAACDIPSTSVVNYNLDELVKKKLITRADNKARGLRVVKNGTPDPTLNTLLDENARLKSEVARLEVLVNYGDFLACVFRDYGCDVRVTLPQDKDKVRRAVAVLTERKS